MSARPRSTRRSPAATGPARLHGLPVAHKDLVDTAGVRTTYGSLVFADNLPGVDEPFVARIREAGAVMVGKTNTPEFGAGSHTFNPVFGATRNPYELSRSAGGSSGGAAAALATGMVPIADGSDLGGSLRNPASFCNVVGFRPSLENDDPLELSTDGPMARTVEDAALLWGAMTGQPARAEVSLRPSGGTARRVGTRVRRVAAGRARRGRVNRAERSCVRGARLRARRGLSRPRGGTRGVLHASSTLLRGRAGGAPARAPRSDQGDGRVEYRAGARPHGSGRRAGGRTDA